MRHFVKKVFGPLILACGGLFGANAALAQETDANTDTANDLDQAVFNISTAHSDHIKQALDLSTPGRLYTELDDAFNAQSQVIQLGEARPDNCDRQSVVRLCDNITSDLSEDDAYPSFFDGRSRDKTRRVYVRMGNTSIERERTDFSKSTALYFYQEGGVDVSVGRYTQRSLRVEGAPRIKQRFKGVRVQKRF